MIQDFQIKPFILRINSSIQVREGLLLYAKKLDGSESWAEVSPLPGFSEETLDEAFAQISSIQKEILKKPLEKILKEQGLFPSVAFGLESLFASSFEPKSYPLCGFLSGNFESIQNEIPFLLKEGYEHIKIKVSQLSFEEAHLVIQTLLGKAKLKIDVNRRWSLEKSLSFFQKYPLDAFEYIEEPVSDPKDLPFFPYPIALDETLREGSFPFLSNVKALILKPMLTGSLNTIEQTVNLSKKMQARVILSSSFESGVGLFHLCSLLERAKIPLHPLGVDTHRLIKEDILQNPHVISKGVLHLSPLRVSYV